MKKIRPLLVIFILLTLSLEAQRRPPGFKNNDKIKALKTAYITNALDLTSKEAEKFWPVYNVYDRRIMDLRFKKTRELRNKVKTREEFDAMKEKDAALLLNDFLNIEKDILAAKSSLNKQLLKIISAKKILKLYKAEDDFNRRLLKRLQNRKGPNKRQGRPN
ncbi:MAG: sensor of ECF-type sigma factor [Flavobacteriaceae bacterium]|nr:sensor of ECF-type sigma factor [Flavobacteriaceae bacterium]